MGAGKPLAHVISQDPSSFEAFKKAVLWTRPLIPLSLRRLAAWTVG